jgi:hypothetical protein
MHVQPSRGSNEETDDDMVDSGGNAETKSTVTPNTSNGVWCGGCNVFLIGYGVVAGFNVGDEKPPHEREP